MRRKVCFFMAAVFMVLLLASCGGAPTEQGGSSAVDAGGNSQSENTAAASETGDREKVVLWMSGDDARYLTEAGLIDRFNDQNEEYYVELVEMPFDTLHDKFLAGVAGGDLPAVSQAADQWVGEFAYLDALMPLDDFMTESGYTEDMFVRGVWDHFRYLDGVIYAAPFYLENRILYYRTDILEEAGFDGPPTTLDEVFAYGEAISNGNDRFAMGHQDGWLDFHFFSYILYAYGGNYYNDERTECILNDELGIAAIEYYKSLYDQNVIPKETSKRVEAFKGFKEGYYAMVESGNWWIGLIENQAPELEGKWGAALLPSGNTETVYGHPNGWMIPKDSPNPEGGKAWIKFALGLETEILISNAYGLSPVMLEAYEDPTLKNSELHVLMRDVSERGADSLHNIPNAEAISEIVWNMLADVRDDLKTPEEAANHAVEKINPLLNP